MNEVTRIVAPWAHLLLDQMVGFVGLLFFSFFGLLGALSKFRVPMLRILVAATLIWGLLGTILFWRQLGPLLPGGTLWLGSLGEWLPAELARRVTAPWIAGMGIGVGLIAVTVMFEKYTSSRAVRLTTLLVRAAVFVAAFWIYLRTYVIRG